MTDTEIRAIRGRAETEYPFAGDCVVRLCDELLALRAAVAHLLWQPDAPWQDAWDQLCDLVPEENT